MISRIDVVLRVTDDRRGETRDFVVSRVVHPHDEANTVTWEQQVMRALRVHQDDVHELLRYLGEDDG